jgi:putative ABC transport system permease protein
MLRLFLVHSLRHFARHPAFTAMNVAGIALGVTVFLSIQIVNHSALQSFRASVDIVAGRADLEIVGDGLRFDENAWRVVTADPDIAAATPTVEDVAGLHDFPGEYLQVLGIDIFSNQPLRTFELKDAGDKKPDVVQFLRDPDTIALTEKLSRRLGLKIGDPIRVDTQAGIKTFRVGFMLQFGEDAPGADEHLAVMDIASAQENFRHLGRLSRISARLRPGADFNAVCAGLRAQLPPGTVIEAPDRRNRQVERMLGAFQLNLTALSLISLLVGMFLIYNTVAAAVVRRRYEIGVLRALGLGRWQVQALFIGEALLLGVVGLVLGLVLGVALAGQLVGAVSQTITSLYILTSIQTLFISPWAILAAMALCLGAVVAAAWFPAREAALIPPVEALSLGHLEDESARTTGRWLATGCGMLLLAALVAKISLSVGPAWLSFGAALFTLLGFAFFVPTVCRLFSRFVRPRAVIPRIAAGHFAQSLHRNSIAIASLVVALAMVVGISTMIFSFRSTVRSWLDKSIQADLVIAPAANLIVGNREVIQPEVEQVVANFPHVTYDSFRELRLQFAGQIVKMAAVRMAVTRDIERLDFSQGDSHDAFDAAIDHEAALVSQPFQRRFRLSRLHDRGRRDSVRLEHLQKILARHLDQRDRRLSRQEIGPNPGAGAGPPAPADRALRRLFDQVERRIARAGFPHLRPDLRGHLSAANYRHHRFCARDFSQPDHSRHRAAARDQYPARGRRVAAADRGARALGGGDHRLAWLRARHRRGPRPRRHPQLRDQRLVLRLDHCLGDAVGFSHRAAVPRRRGRARGRLRPGPPGRAS